MTITEPVWLSEAARPRPLAVHLLAHGKGRVSRRRAYLLGLALVRRRWPAEADGPELAVLERYADGAADEAEFLAARAAVAANRVGYTSLADHLDLLFNLHTFPAIRLLATRLLPARTDDPGWCDLIRDVAGNPFRPWKAVPESLGGGLVQPDGATVRVSAAARQVAAGIAIDGAFDRLPILADALDDCGVTDPGLLAHCRRPGGHVRGCWAVDVVAGRG
jgi:hypothetical protein